MSLSEDYYQQRVGKIFSAAGGWRIGGSVWFHGEDLHNTVVPRDGYFSYLMHLSTGTLPDPALARWVEAAFMCMSWPDSRIWCNYVGALMGDLGSSPVAGALMGTLASDSYMYGGGAALGLHRSVSEITRLRATGLTPRQIVDQHIERNNGKLRLMGYSRPIAKGDERVKVLVDLARSLGLEKGPHETAALEVDEYLHSSLGEGLNGGGVMAAVVADHGIDDAAFYDLFSFCTIAGVLACYKDAKARPARSFLPMRVSDYDYTGPDTRSVD